MAAISMDMPMARNSPNGGFHDALYNNNNNMSYIGSDELNRLIAEDVLGWEDDVLAASVWDDEFGIEEDLSKYSPKTWEQNLSWKYKLENLLVEDDYLTEPVDILVHPETGRPVQYPFKPTEIPEEVTQPIPIKPAPEPPKPYHWSQDHDYLKSKAEDCDDETDVQTKELDKFIDEMFQSDDEPVVEVWEIDNFNEEPDTKPARNTDPYQAKKKETRRTSSRTAEIKRREQARKISNAVHAVFKNNRPQRTRQYKNIKPKNSVETTPSQSDIEEWYSQPVRPTYTKITKKKTSKGRIDHSESERHRREVLRRNFNSLSALIPNRFLRGEKSSAQVSKQKILNGAKAYITELNSKKSSYKFQYNHNRLLKEKWQKKCKLLKCIKKEK